MQNILVLIIVLAAAIYLGRRLYRSFFCRDAGCSCGSDCDSCDLKKNE